MDDSLEVRPLKQEDALLFARFATGFGQGQLDEERMRRNRAGLVALGAWFEGIPSGLFLGAIDSSTASRFMRVLTLRVVEHHRRRGIATLLLIEAEQRARAAECHFLSALFADGSPESVPAQALANRDGWLRFRLTRTVYKVPYPTVDSSHWGGRPQRWPKDFEVFPWRDVTVEERTRLLAQQDDPRHFDRGLAPFKRGQECTENSIGLRVKGEIAGWAVSWPLSPDSLDRATMAGTRLFVGSRLQSRGYGVMLMVEHFQRGRAAGINCALFSVLADNLVMLRFMKKHFCSIVSHRREIWEVRKMLLHSS